MALGMVHSKTTTINKRNVSVILVPLRALKVLFQLRSDRPWEREDWDNVENDSDETVSQRLTAPPTAPLNKMATHNI